MHNKQILLIVFILILNILGKTWAKLPKNYNNLVFVSFFNASYYYIYQRKLLWEFSPNGIPINVLRALHIFFVTPFLVLLFLSNAPQKVRSKIAYSIKWTVVSTVIENLLHKERVIQYNHHWNSLWSSLVYLLMYTCSLIFKSNPLLALVISVLSLSFFIVKFPVHFNNRFLKGPMHIFWQRRSPLYNKFLQLLTESKIPGF
ncbi:CBO0543 family protein [Halalkalibacter suaedae]|uniref:CBO0543 family protein n=1 Tax=Halalkalibacter suaedae TaxID=2822140 RepID=UPI003AF00309